MSVKKIKISKDGPYLVSGKIPLNKEKIVSDKYGTPISWKKIEEIKTEESYALCRCGHSCNKPFCDGSHLKKKFNGTETASKRSFNSEADKVNGKNLILKDLPKLCASAGFCHRAGGIWELVKKADKNSMKIAMEEACDCPSGRLVVIDKKTKKEIEPKFEESISLIEELGGLSGPLWAKGKLIIESADGTKYEVRNRVTLCRCGNSENKPFCDGSHASTKFSDRKNLRGKTC